jgi:cation transport ATPase
MFTLIAMGVGVAWAYSMIAVLAPDMFPPAFRDASGAAPVYFEAAAVIVVLVLLGQVLELRARERTGVAIKALLNLAPKTARRLREDGTDEEVTLDQIRVGDRLRVRPGEKIPVDGALMEGRVSIDESLVTGESMPVTREAGGKVIAGSINKTGSFVMRAEKVGADTLLSRIVQMVAEAQRSRAPIQRMADQVAGWFVPAVIGVAILAFAGWAGPRSPRSGPRQASTRTGFCAWPPAWSAAVSIPWRTRSCGPPRRAGSRCRRCGTSTRRSGRAFSARWTASASCLAAPGWSANSISTWRHWKPRPRPRRCGARARR